jgi:hypothetical protein
VGFMDLANWIWGCSHRRTTLPVTHNAETYVVCLECGRRFAYDWARMREASRWSFQRSPPEHARGPERNQPERGKHS